MKATLAYALGALTMTGAAAYQPTYDIKYPPGNPAVVLEAGDFADQYISVHEGYYCVEFVLTEKVTLPAGRRIRIDPTPTLNMAVDLCEVFAGSYFCDYSGQAGLPVR